MISTLGLKAVYSDHLGTVRDSDESVGLVLKKTIYNGNRTSAELSQAKALADSAYEKLRYTFREENEMYGWRKDYFFNG